jgi:CBS domain-containing protein
MKLSAPISDLMTKNVVCVSPNQKIIDLKHIYEKQQFHHHIPVTENDNLIGMVSLIDFMRAIHTATLDDTEVVYHALCVKDIMTENPVSMAENTPIKEVAEVLSKGQFHSIVITENNAVKGIITTADLLRFFLSEN